MVADKFVSIGMISSQISHVAAALNVLLPSDHFCQGDVYASNLFPMAWYLWLTLSRDLPHPGHVVYSFYQ